MEFGLLGPVEVWLAGQMADVGHPRQRAVLAVLLLDLDRVVAAETLVDRVWGTAPPPSVRNALYGYVARLRAVIVGAADPEVTLVRRSGGYSLHAKTEQLDLHRFRNLVTEAATVPGDDQRVGALLQQALGLWRGPALAGLDSPWLHGMRDTMEQERAAAALDLNDIKLRQGMHAALIGELAGQAAASPADERLIGQLMLALYRSGRQFEALGWYEQTRRHLASEIGADPGPQLQALHQQILCADPSLTVRPVPVSLRPERIPRELPSDVLAFTGRVAELAELSRLLASSADGKEGAVISAVSGTPGVGKTALAVHWAHQVAGEFPDGQLYVDLRGHHPDRPMAAADVLAGFLRALGVAGKDISVEKDERAALYRSVLAGRRVLVVLDNAGSVEQVRPLLPGGSACAVVVTSRDSVAGLVARNGATRLEVDLLPSADAVLLLRRLIGERADADPDATAKLATQCCRLPLALRIAAELAAERPAVALSDLAGELADQQRRLDLLDADGDPETAVRAVFSWSYRNLDPDVARAFRLIGLHPGPELEPYAVAALTATTLEHARKMLGVLARANLIYRTGPGRYGVHDLLRAYARELGAVHDGANGQRTSVTRLLDYYLQTAAAAMDTLYPGERQRRPRIQPSATPTPPLASSAAAQFWLDDERATLTAVTVHATGFGWPDHATRLGAVLFRYLYLGSHYPEAVTVYTHAIGAAHSIGDHAAEAAALTSLGAIDWNQARYGQASSRHRQALEMFREAGDRDGQARALGNLGITYAAQGRLQEAVSIYGQALNLFHEAGDRAGEVRTLCNLGIVEEKMGRYKQAASRQKESIIVAREIGARDTEYLALLNLGIVRLRQGSCTQAADDLQRTLALCREIGYRAYEAVTLTRIGDVCLRQGSPDDAVGYLEEALSLFREIGDQSGEADALNSLGEVLIATGQPDDAHAKHAAALDLADPIGDKYEQARARNGLGHAFHATGERDQACSHWRQAFSLFRELGCPEANQVRTHLRELRLGSTSRTAPTCP